MYKYGYENEKKIEVELFGLVFEIGSISETTKKEFEEDEDTNKVDSFIERIIGNGSIEKINKKRVEDGYKEMTLEEKSGLLGFLFESYVKGLEDKVLGGAMKEMDEAPNRYERRYNRRRNYRNSRRY